MSALAIDNRSHAVPPLPKNLRLSDAEKIATDRLDSASITSLKAALAGVTANDAAPAHPSLVERIDAAAKLAADATAAAQAVETLKGLLQAQLEAGRAPAPQPAEPGIIALPDAAPQPLPADEPIASVSQPPLTEQKRVDVRGFFAGFALSGAIGAVLYLYMMAG